MGDASKKEGGFFFNPLGYRHPIVSEFQGQPDPVDAGLTQAITWQYHKLMLPPRARRPRSRWRSTTAIRRSIEAHAAPGDRDPGGDLGRHGLDDLAAAQELSADHAADRLPSLGRPARRAEHPGRPAVRPVVSRCRGSGPGHGDQPQGDSVVRPSCNPPAASASFTSSRPTWRAFIR